MQQSQQPGAVLRQLIRSGASIQMIDAEILRQGQELAATKSARGCLTEGLIRENRRYLYAVLTGHEPRDGRRVTSYNVQRLISAVGTVPVRPRERQTVNRTHPVAPQDRLRGGTPLEVRERVFRRFRFYDQYTDGRDLRVSRLKQCYKELVHLLRDTTAPLPWEPAPGEGDRVDRLLEAVIADYRRVYPTPEAAAAADAGAQNQQAAAPAPQAPAPAAPATAAANAEPAPAPTAQPRRRTRTRRTAAATAAEPGAGAGAAAFPPDLAAVRPAATAAPAANAAAQPRDGQLTGTSLGSVLAQARRNLPQLVINAGTDPRHQFKDPIWWVFIGSGGVNWQVLQHFLAEVKVSNADRAAERTRALLRALGRPVPEPMVLGERMPQGFVPDRVSVFDGDHYEPRNVARQCNRYAAEMGAPKVAVIDAIAKAQILATEPDWLLPLEAHLEYIETADRLAEIVDAIPAQYTVMLVDAVDNWATRFIIYDYYVHRMHRKGGWLSGGNKTLEDPQTGEMTHYGQAVLSLRDERGLLLPTVVDWDPEVLRNIDLLPSQVSCGEVAMRIVQTRHLNSEAANRMRNFLLDLLHHRPLDYCRIDFNLDAGWSKQKNTAENLARVGHAEEAWREYSRTHRPRARQAG